MFNLIKQVFITLMSFCISLSTKCVSLNNETCMINSFLIDLNLAELKYCPFMISSDKCSGSCNSIDDLSTKICVPSKTKDINVQVQYETNKNEAKTLVKHISWH